MTTKRLLAWMVGIAVLACLLGTPSPAQAAKRWREYTDCQLIPDAANDGDSFHVRAGNIKSKTYLFRLYFVDAPESDFSLPDRLQEQMEYFSLPDIATTVKVGKEATKFAENFLKNGFMVYSRLADARGRSKMKRDYAVVMVGDKDLAVELVRNGLARVFGMATDYPDGTPQKKVWARLKAAEQEAKAARRGAWAYSVAPRSSFDKR